MTKKALYYKFETVQNLGSLQVSQNFTIPTATQTDIRGHRITSFSTVTLDARKIYRNISQKK